MVWITNGPFWAPVLRYTSVTFTNEYRGFFIAS